MHIHPSFLSSLPIGLSNDGPQLSQFIHCPSSISLPQRSAAMSAIEVERKFTLTPLVKQTFLSLTTPKAARVVRFRDRYYDEHLATRDMWLRQRNDIWELKLPIDISTKHDVSSSNCATTVYKEITGFGDVSRALPHTDFDQLICFATIDTERTQLAVPWKNNFVNVTLDECSSTDDDFHCSIGELELMVNHHTHVDKALRDLDDFVDFLEVRQVEEKEGKVLKYLRKYNPDLFQKVTQVLSN